MQALVAVKTFCLDLLFPIECLGCGVSGAYLCVSCFNKIPIQESFVCPMCLKPSFEHATCRSCRRLTKLNGVIAASFYDHALLRRLVFAYKYGFVKSISTPLAQLVLKCLALHDHSLFHRGDLVLVQVPLALRRERWRGFNQAAELAQEVSRALGVPQLNGVLLRTRATAAQVETESREERLDNIRKAFAVSDPDALRKKVVLLVDDIATSLATLNECARTLKESGAKEVWGLVVARDYLKK